MVERKIEGYRADEATLADLAKALSHPVRIRILTILAKRETCVCGEIVDLLPLSQSTVSQHLKELKRVGLIQGEIEGPRTCYCLDPAALGRARRAFESLFSSVASPRHPRKGKRNAE